MVTESSNSVAIPGKQQILIREGILHLPTSPKENPYLIGSKCSHCGNVSFPKKVVCPACVRDDTMQEIPLSRIGKINSFTVAHVAPPGFKAPYIVAYVDFPEVSRVFGLVTGCEPVEESLQIGMEVEVVVDKIREDDKGNDLIGYKFRPVKK